MIPDGAIVIMYSGLGRYYGNKTAYFGWPDFVTDPKDTKNLHFPGLAPQAAQHLVDNRKIFGVGVDTPSTDYGQAKKFQTHQILAKANIWGLENLNNVDKLPAKGFTVYNGAYKSTDGSGGPSRVIAVMSSSGASKLAPKLLISVLFCLFLPAKVA